MLAAVVLAPNSAAENCESLSGLGDNELAQYQFEQNTRPLRTLSEGDTYVLRDLKVVHQPIFEATASRLQRAANRYHRQTRERVILSATPIRPGELVTPSALRETERILRSKTYLYDARVIPLQLCGDQLDVAIVLRDVWTLTPILNINRSGGENAVSFGIADNNLLGLGKNLSLVYRDEQDRDGVQVLYNDPNLAGSRWTLDARAIDSDDGGRLRLATGRPFFSLDTRWSTNFAIDEFKRDEGLYLLGAKIWEFEVHSKAASASIGFSNGLHDGFVNRWSLGLAIEDHEFEFPVIFPFEQPEDRNRVYPFVSFEHIEDKFAKRVNLDRVQRTEDIALGNRLFAQLGWSLKSFGADRDEVVGRISLSHSRLLADRDLFTLGADVHTYYDLDEARFEELRALAFVTYQWNHGKRFNFLARAEYIVSKNLPVDQQVLLGGFSGLRGYPNRYQAGDRSFLVTLEERYYSNVYPFRLFRLGGALFVDVGRAWYHDEPPDWVVFDRSGDEFDILANVGVGLRLESTRTRRDAVLHLDLAFPLRDGPFVSDAELTISVKRSL